jgi:uncharacterized protein YukE
MSGGFFDVDTGVLRQIAGDLDTAGGDAAGTASDLGVRPDAGQSTGEVGESLSRLSEAITALGQALTEASTSVRESADDYDASDASSQQTMSGPGAVPR